MTNDELNLVLAKNIARVIVNTCIEGYYNTVCCSTKMDYPSIGCSQWEGSRADDLLSNIGGEATKFIGKKYSDMVADNSIEELKEILGSERGINEQVNLLASDTLQYVRVLRPLFTNSLCLVYAGCWCPTSTYVVNKFCSLRKYRGYDIDDLEVLHQLFFDEYPIAASCEEYTTGYQNRCLATYKYLKEEGILWGI